MSKSALHLYRSTAMPLLHRTDNDLRMDECELKVGRLVRLVKEIGRFPRYELRAHSSDLEVVLESIAKILDNAEGK